MKFIKLNPLFSKAKPCFFWIFLAAFFTSAFTAFHGLQTIAPTHGRLGDAWEWALDSIGLDEDIDATMSALVTPEGYPLEEHFVTTEDGYILRMFRIPEGRTGSTLSPDSSTAGEADQKQMLQEVQKRVLQNGRPRPPVLLQHALLDCSASWVNNGAAQSLGFMLADAGFDVWMGNVRGNTFSRNHTTLPTGSEEFWDFSWDDMAAKDLPAMVGHVLNATGAPSVGYVGHSQGTAMLLAAVSENPRLASKVSAAVLLAPVAFTSFISSSPIRAMAELDTEEVFEALGSKEFLPSRKVNHDAWSRLCHLFLSACGDAIGMICGYSAENMNTTRLPLYLAYTPAGTSVKNMAHWSQGVRRREPEFLKYDYGTSCRGWLGQRRPCNQHAYGQRRAPSYDLSRVTVPLMLISGGRDKLADPRDVQLLREALPPNTVAAWHQEPSYEHLDFTWAKNAHRLIYPRLIAFLANRLAGAVTAAGPEVM